MEEQYPDVVFSVPTEDVESLLATLRQQASLDIDVLSSAGASGGGDMVSVLVQIAPNVLTFLSGVIVAWIAKPGASIEVDGTKIKAAGVSRSMVEEVLRDRLSGGREPEKSNDTND